MSSELEAALAGVADGWLGEDNVLGEERWLPLVAISRTGIWLGLSPHGQWAIGRPNEEVTIGLQSMSQGWLTILDWEEHDLKRAVALSLTSKGINTAELHMHLPIDELLILGIRSQSRHWAKRAVSWLTQRHPTPQQQELLREMVSARWADQWTRHAARRLMRTSAGIRVDKIPGVGSVWWNGSR